LEIDVNRRVLVNLHLGLASLFLPFLLLIPLSGGLYLAGQKGEQTKTEVFQIEGPVPEDAATFFREQFKARNIDFDFELVRSAGADYILRPSSRVHYMATLSGSTLIFYKMEPDWIKRLIEIHKGHGPAFIKWIQMAFALAIILVTLSGIYLAATIPAYRKVMLICFGMGLLLLLGGLF